MRALLIAETTPKLMRLAGFARQYVRDYHWTAITTAGLGMIVDRFCIDTESVRMKIRNKTQLNRIAAMAAEVDVVFLAMDATERGDLLAADLAECLAERFADRPIRRLRLHRLSADSFRSEFASGGTVDSRRSAGMRVSRILNFIVSTAAKKVTKSPVGRTVIPGLAVCRGLDRPDDARLSVRLASGVELTSPFEPAGRIESAYKKLTQQVPGLQVRTRETTLQPPRLYRVATFQQDACRILGLRSVEVASQLRQLYWLGFVAWCVAPDEAFGDLVRAELKAFGDAPGGSVAAEGVIVPLDPRCLPNDAPRPLRALYRLVWANTLCGYASPMPVTIETATTIIEGVRLTGESVIPRANGFDRSSFGLLYRRGHIGANTTIESARLYRGGPFEDELIERLDRTLPLNDPALVIQAMHQLHYIEFDEREVCLMPKGREILDAIEQQVPQLLDPCVYRATEAFLRSRYDPEELIGPWSRWAASVASAVRSGRVAYLR